jgi:hypothetical protein
LKLLFEIGPSVSSALNRAHCVKKTLRLGYLFFVGQTLLLLSNEREQLLTGEFIWLSLG